MKVKPYEWTWPIQGSSPFSVVMPAYGDCFIAFSGEKIVGTYENAESKEMIIYNI